MTSEDGTIAWRELYEEARERLTGFVDHPDVDARRIVEEASGHQGGQFALGLDDLVTERGVARFDTMMQRRLAGEPLQYVIGRWGFRRLDLAVDGRVLIPRPETETVVEIALGELDRIGGRRVVDLGTGSGAIALSVAVERDHAAVWAVERSAEALALARANLAGTGRAATRVTMLEGTWYEPLPAELAGTIDLIIANPPYIGSSEELPPVVVDWEPGEALIAGPVGTEQIDRIVDEAPTWLTASGVLVVELAPHQGPVAVERARSVGFGDVSVQPDLTGRDRALVARR